RRRRGSGRADRQPDRTRGSAREDSNRVRHDVTLEDRMPTSTSLSDSPFLDVRSFETPTERITRRLGLSSPFVEAFAFEHAESDGDPRSAARRVLLAELYDEEFDDAVYEAIGETAGFAGNGDGKLGIASARLRLVPLADEI